MFSCARKPPSPRTVRLRIQHLSFVLSAGAMSRLWFVTSVFEIECWDVMAADVWWVASPPYQFADTSKNTVASTLRDHCRSCYWRSFQPDITFWPHTQVSGWKTFISDQRCAVWNRKSSVLCLFLCCRGLFFRCRQAVRLVSPIPFLKSDNPLLTFPWNEIFPSPYWSYHMLLTLKIYPM